MTATLELTDLARSKRVRVDLSGDALTPQHTVAHAIEHFRAELGIPEHSLRWMAFARGRRLDAKTALADVPAEDTTWTVMPEVAAGGRP
jgi:hypothetical protein